MLMHNKYVSSVSLANFEAYAKSSPKTSIHTEISHPLFWQGHSLVPEFVNILVGLVIKYMHLY